MASDLSNLKEKIPAAMFIDDVDAYMKQTDNLNPENVVVRLSNTMKKHQFIEQNLLLKKDRLKKEIPDLNSNLEMLDFLKEQSVKKNEFEVTYNLDHGVYSQAKIGSSDNVAVWLGANVMLEYPLDEAIVLLQKRLENMKSDNDENDESLDYLKDQITTLQVNISRVYNWTVKNGKLE